VPANLDRRQVHLHERFGGVVPEVAAARHVEALNPLLAEALEAGGLSGSATSTASAVTVGPGSWARSWSGWRPRRACRSRRARV
jgi:N6-L-threonylcarbamoyladenine synthase